MYTHEMTPQEKWENATIANNFIFYKIMRNNPDVCQEFIERLLQIEIDHIEMAQEEEIDVDLNSKAIRMDVYAKNRTQAFDLEMQSIDSKELPERSRYYQGIMDVDNLKSGEPYSKMKDSYVIFICITDLFGFGLPKYQFENIQIDDLRIKLNDRSYKYFFIAENCDKLLDEKQKELLKLVKDNVSTDSFSSRILKLVSNAKKNSQWRHKYMEYERQRTYDLLAGEEKGRSKAKLEAAVIAVNKYHAPAEEVAKDFAVPLEELKFKLSQNLDSSKNSE